MTTIVLPVAARAALRAVSPSAELIARPSGLLHLYAGKTPGLRDFTLNGILRRPGSPVCGRSAPRWYLHEPDGRRLCGHCSAWARRNLPSLDRAPVTVEDLAAALEVATTATEVDAVQSLALARGITSVRVIHGRPPQPTALHRVIATTRTRVTPARVGVVERNWLERRPASRFPRRIA